MSMRRRILHLDMDAFYAAVELLRRPDLKGKPVVIGGRGEPGVERTGPYTGRGVVTTATYEARAFGIHSAMSLRVAQRLCPQAVFLPTDFEEYRRVSALFKAQMLAVSPLMEDRGIDEAYLDVSELALDSEEIGRDIKRRVLEATQLTCSVGIAPNKLLAKMASELQKPDGLTLLAEDDVPRRIWPLEARKLPGVGPVTEKKLASFGIRTIGDIAAQLMHQDPAARRGDQHLGAARVPVAVRILARLVHVEGMVGVLDERYFHAFGNKERHQFFYERGLAAARPARESESFHRPSS